MKRTLLLMAAGLCTLLTFAQKEMPTVWEAELDHKIYFHGTTDGEDGMSYAASDKMLTFFNNKDGKTVWTKKFSDIAPRLKKIDELIPFWESGMLFVFERKMGRDQVACVSMIDGKLLWSTDKYQNLGEENVMYISEIESFTLSLKDQLVLIKAKTGEELWTTARWKGAIGKYVYLNDESIVALNFKPSLLAALFSGFKNQIARINMKNGDIMWEAIYVGMAERKVITKENLFDLKIIDDKVILVLNGYQVYDFNTGQMIYSAAFDFTPNGITGKPANAEYWGVYGGIADPVIVGNDLYVIDMSNRRNQYLKKYDFNTGRLLWTSSEIKEAKAIPKIVVIDDKVLLQIGGIVEIQAKIKTETEYMIIYTYKVDFKNIKPCGVQAFNTSDGKLAWDSERFRKGITNMIEYENKVIVCSGKSLYSIDYKTGKDNYEVPVTKGGVGEATQILPYKDMIAVIGEKGISTFKIADGSFVANGKYENSSMDSGFGNIVVMKTDKADIAAFDLETCKYLEFKAKKGADTEMRDDGKYVYVYESKVVTKVKTSI